MRSIWTVDDSEVWDREKPEVGTTSILRRIPKVSLGN